MEVSTQIKLRFHGVDFPVINLHSSQPYVLSEDNPINFDITPKVFYPQSEPDIFKIVQEIHLTSDKYFSLMVIAVGIFEIDANIDPEIKKNFVNQNAPAIMFPYIRSFISTLTANIGNITGLLTIPTQFFKGELEELKDIPQ
jgi:preprotein translocase subunit SecB